jgi:hypothetical protein
MKNEPSPAMTTVRWLFARGLVVRAKHVPIAAPKL